MRKLVMFYIAHKLNFNGSYFTAHQGICACINRTGGDF